MEGHLPAGYSASPSLPPSPSVRLAVPRCVTGYTQDASDFPTGPMFAKDIRKNVRSTCTNECRELSLASLFASLAQGRPKLVLLPTPGGREKPEVPAESWATNAGGTLSSLIFQDYFTIAKPPATCNH